MFKILIQDDILPRSLDQRHLTVTHLLDRFPQRVVGIPVRFIEYQDGISDRRTISRYFEDKRFCKIFVSQDMPLGDLEEPFRPLRSATLSEKSQGKTCSRNDGF